MECNFAGVTERWSRVRLNSRWRAPMVEEVPHQTIFILIMFKIRSLDPAGVSINLSSSKLRDRHRRRAGPQAAPVTTQTNNPGAKSRADDVITISTTSCAQAGGRRALAGHNCVRCCFSPNHPCGHFADTPFGLAAYKEGLPPLG